MCYITIKNLFVLIEEHILSKEDYMNYKYSEILRVPDLMNYLCIGKDKAYSLMRSRSFPSTQIGKTYFVTKENFEKWLNENAGKSIEV